MKLKEKDIDREFFQIVNPLLKTKMVKDLSLYRQHYFQSRLEHSIAVSYYSYRIGRSLNLNYYAMARGGLLHDLFFYDWRDVTFSKGNHAKNHPRIALMNAKQITEISPLEEDIIVNHMMGSTLDITRSREAFIVSMVDKYLATSEVCRSVYFKLFAGKSPRSLENQLFLMEFHQ